jgi:hypothetical protein
VPYIINFHSSCSYEFFFPSSNEIGPNHYLFLSCPDHLFCWVQEPFLTMSITDYPFSFFFFIIIWLGCWTQIGIIPHLKSHVGVRHSRGVQLTTEVADLNHWIDLCLVCLVDWTE